MLCHGVDVGYVQSGRVVVFADREVPVLRVRVAADASVVLARGAMSGESAGWSAPAKKTRLGKRKWGD